MSWNGSDRENQVRGQRSEVRQRNDKVRASTSRFNYKALSAGVTVIVLGSGALWYFGRARTPSAPLDEGAKRPSSIREVTPAKPPLPKPEKPKPAAALQAKYPHLNIPDSWDKPYPPQAYRADGSLKRHSRYVTMITAGVFRASLSVEDRAFSNKAERDICSLLCVEPGSVVVGDYEYGEQFVKDFLESLKTPIVISPDDDDEVREMKKWVKETKLDLKARMDRGEDIAEIMNESRKQFKELGLYREDIRKMVQEAKAKSGGELTKQDEIDLITAANQMLEDRGCKPLALPDAFIEKAGQDAEDNANQEAVENE